MLGRINYMKHMLIITCILAFLSQNSISEPIDLKAGEAFQEIEGIFKQPLLKRKISKEQTELFIKRAEIDNQDMQICVSIAFAFAEDSNSLNILKKLSLNSSYTVKGAASYALKIRQISGRKQDEILRNLCFFLGKSDNQIEKMFLANRMWVDYKEEAIYTILDAIQLEPNDIDNVYRCDLFYYLSQSNKPEILKKALHLEWRNDVLVSLPENLAYIMGSITPGRRKDNIGNSAMFIEENIRKILGQK
jgi:hypothetical protein